MVVDYDPNSIDDSWKPKQKFAPSVILTLQPTDDLFCYGKRFSDEDLEEVSIEEQVTNQLAVTQEDPEKPLLIHGRLLLRRTEDDEKMVLLKSGSSILEADIDSLEDFSYFDGMLGTFECALTTPTCLKASSFIRPQPMPLAAIQGKHDSLRVIVIQGLMMESENEEKREKRIEWLVKKVLSSDAHALILSGPFADPADTKKFLATSSHNFQLLCAKLKGQMVQVFVLPNPLYDPTSINVFPTPAMTFDNFRMSGKPPSNFHFVTDPSVFNINGVRFAVTCSQSVWMLSAAEKFQGVNSGERMARLCGHILDQRSLCPTTLNDRVSVLREDFRPHLTERPHFIIVPCHLVTFTKINQNVVFVNPQFCAKNICRYAFIDVNLRAARENKNSTGQLNISDFSRIDLQKEPI
ncbi:DNA polymerase alpha subunit B-like protein [Aphelenchoides besseyi]|nr:DNA polymerase alpha subunit B-like protein [Aphelenchoides besseyi]